MLVHDEAVYSRNSFNRRRVTVCTRIPLSFHTGFWLVTTSNVSVNALASTDNRIFLRFRSFYNSLCFRPFLGLKSTDVSKSDIRRSRLRTNRTCIVFKHRII